MKRIFESSLERLGRIIASQHNINIIFKGQMCCTDGKTIWLPACSDLDESVMAEMYGFLDHEVSHCLFTDFSSLEKHLLTGNLKQFHKHLSNACEDERIERLMIVEYPGSKINLDVINNKFTEINNVSIVKKEMPWPSRLIVAIRCVMSGETPILDDETRDYFEECLHISKKLNSCENTTDILKMCSDITKIIFKMHEEKKEEGKDKSEDSGKKDKNNSSESSSESESSESSESESSESSESESSESSERLMSGDKEEWDKQNITIEDRIEKLIESINHQSLRSNKKHIPFTTEFDEVTDKSKMGDQNVYRSMVRNISNLVNPLKRELEMNLKTQEKRRWSSEKERGLIDARSLSKLAIDRNFNKPFKEKVKTETNNVAVEILIDLSGSMARGRRIETARDTAIAFAECLNSLNISFEITGFHTMSERRIKAPGSNIFNRFDEKMQYVIFKEFESRKMAGLSLIDHGNNNVDPEAIQWAANRLSMRRENRKILIIMTDGKPFSSSSDSLVMINQMKSDMDKMKKSGLEVMAIGINSNHVKYIYEDYIVINDLKDMVTSSLKKLSKLLVNGGKK